MLVHKLAGLIVRSAPAAVLTVFSESRPIMWSNAHRSAYLMHGRTDTVCSTVILCDT